MTEQQDRRLPKTFSDALARRLNGACRNGDGCDVECAGIGWCGRCWDAASTKTRRSRSADRPETPI